MVVVLGLALFGEVAIGLDAVLEAVELPARVCNLAPGLADWTRSGLAGPAGGGGQTGPAYR